jgi:hypothetical protein
VNISEIIPSPFQDLIEAHGMGFFFVITEVQSSHQIAVSFVNPKLAIDFEKLSLENEENFWK